jgi:impB/mucB/samB family C-terminal domain
MEACMETGAPLVASPAPAWALRVARPATDGLRMAEGLRGVPKPALQTIFGKSLGRRIWEQARAKDTPACTPPTDGIADTDISNGMVAYISRQAAATLRESERQARGLSITITYTDGESTVARTRLARATNDRDEIAEAAIELLRQVSVRAVALVSIRLAMTGVELAAVRESAKNLGHSVPHAPARAWRFARRQPALQGTEYKGFADRAT